MKQVQWWLLKAQVFVASMLGRRDVAILRLREMKAMNPDDPQVWMTLAHFLAESSRYTEAIDLLQRACDHVPDRADLHFNLGFVLEHQGRFDDAEQAFRKALSLNPALDRAWYGLGLILLKQSRFDEALLALTKNTELQPMSPYGWYLLGQLHLKQRQPERTQEIIRHLEGFEPKVAMKLRQEAAAAA